MSQFGETTLNTGSGGPILATSTFVNPGDSAHILMPWSALTYLVSGNPYDTTGVFQTVDATHGMPTQIVAGTALIGHVIVDSMAGTSAVSIADGSNTTFGAEADAAAAGDTSTATYMGLFKRLLQRITTLLAQLPAALTGSGNLKAAIVESTATVTIAGTVTANAGSGTLAVSAASLPLPAGAATAAKQPALGTAGTASADVLTVQGIASMTALKVDGSGVTQPVSIGGTVAVSGAFWQATQPVSGTVTANAGSGTFTVGGTVTANIGTTNGLALDATVSGMSGKLPATLGQHAMAASTSIVIASDQSAIPVSGTFWQATQPISAASLPLPTGAATAANQSTEITALQAIQAGSAVSLGSKTSANSVPVVIASDQAAVQATVSANLPGGASTSLQASPSDPPISDGTVGLLVRELREDNAYTQELLGQLVGILNSVLSTPGTAANNTKPLVLGVIPFSSQGAGNIGIGSWGSVNVGAATLGTAPTMSSPGNGYAVVAQSQSYPLHYPMHLYDSGCIGGAV